MAVGPVWDGKGLTAGELARREWGSDSRGNGTKKGQGVVVGWAWTLTDEAHSIKHLTMLLESLTENCSLPSLMSLTVV